jgi:hypothetical protein
MFFIIFCFNFFFFAVNDDVQIMIELKIGFDFHFTRDKHLVDWYTVLRPTLKDDEMAFQVP